MINSKTFLWASLLALPAIAVACSEGQYGEAPLTSEPEPVVGKTTQRLTNVACCSSSQWTPVGDFGANQPVNRLFHNATKIPSSTPGTPSKVLVTGGLTGDTNAPALKDAWLFDPALLPGNPWLQLPDMNSGRKHHRTVYLPTVGKVLITGGGTSTIAQSTFETFDPTTPSAGFTQPSQTMSMSRMYHMLTVLPDGRALVAGGYTPHNNLHSLLSAEIYSPSTNTWSSVGDMHEKRTFGSLEVLPNGNALVIGGSDSGVQSKTAEVFNPATSDWTYVMSGVTPAEMSTGRNYSTVARLPTGDLVIAGDALYTTFTDVYDWQQNRFLATNPAWNLNYGHAYGASATGLVTSEILLTGGSSDKAELRGTDGIWRAAPSMSTTRTGHTATTLDDGRVLVIGGGAAGALFAEIFTPCAGN